MMVMRLNKQGVPLILLLKTVHINMIRVKSLFIIFMISNLSTRID